MNSIRVKIIKTYQDYTQHEKDVNSFLQHNTGIDIIDIKLTTDNINYYSMIIYKCKG